MNSFLKVPYVQQSLPNSCFAAVASAVYKFYGVERTEGEIWQKRKKSRPGKTEEFIYTKDIVDDAKELGFEAYSAQMDLSDKKTIIDTLKKFKNQNIPLIVINQFTENSPTVGHVRIITNTTNTSIYFHDPHFNPSIGGKNIRWDIQKFINRWKKTGEEVIGGQYLVIKRK